MTKEEFFSNPFRGKINDLNREMYSRFNLPPEERRSLSQIRSELIDLEKKEIEYKKEFGRKVAENTTRRIKEPQVEGCETMGIPFSQAMESEKFRTISEMLFSKRALEEKCLVSNEDFSSEVNAEVTKELLRFNKKADELLSGTSFSGLKEHVEGVKKAVKAKQHEAGFGQHEQTSNLQVACKARCSCGPVQVALGPTINLEKGVPFSRSNINLGLDIHFNQSNSNQKSGVEVSLSATEGAIEMGVESNFSSAGIEYGYTAQVHGFSNFSAGLSVRSKSFASLCYPMTAVNNGQLFCGRTIKHSGLGTNVQFGVLPVEKLRNFGNSSVNENRFDSGFPSFNEQNRVDCKAKEDAHLVFKQDGSEIAFPLAEVQQESNEQEDLNFEKKEVPNFVKARNSRQASQIAISTPPPQPPQRPRPYVHGSSTFIEWLLLAVGTVLGFGFLVYIWELFCKPDDKNKDL